MGLSMYDMEIIAIIYTINCTCFGHNVEYIGGVVAAHSEKANYL